MNVRIARQLCTCANGYKKWKGFPQRPGLPAGVCKLCALLCARPLVTSIQSVLASVNKRNELFFGS